MATEPIGQPQVFSMATLAGLVETDAASRHQRHLSGELLGPVPPFEKLQKAIGGFFEPGLHVLHGSPGLGKTAMALQTAARCQTPALFVSCEIGVLQLVWRLMAQFTFNDYNRFRGGYHTPAAVAEIFRTTAQQCPMLHIADGLRAPVKPADLAVMVEGIRKTHGSDHLLIVIDSVHAWATGVYSDRTEYDALRDACEELSAHGVSWGVPILGVAERNRASQKEGGQNASAGSRKFEYKAESVFGLDRDPDQTPDPTSTAVLLDISKNRNGEANGQKLNFMFNGPRMLYSEA